MPLLKAKKALNELAAGVLLRVIATDPGSVRDFEVFSQQSGNALLESKQADGRFEYLLRKKGYVTRLDGAGERADPSVSLADFFSGISSCLRAALLLW